jgi:hypothetical protein
MTTAEITSALAVIRQETDLNAKALLMAGLVSELFRERGFEPVVVGGSAIEFYTDGAYMSGDTDICWTGWPQPDEEQRRRSAVSSTSTSKAPPQCCVICCLRC